MGKLIFNETSSFRYSVFDSSDLKSATVIHIPHGSEDLCYWCKYNHEFTPEESEERTFLDLYKFECLEYKKVKELPFRQFVIITCIGKTFKFEPDEELCRAWLKTQKENNDWSFKLLQEKREKLLILLRKWPKFLHWYVIKRKFSEYRNINEALSILDIGKNEI